MLKGQLAYKGERGYSAYEIAVQNGYEGSEQDWLATLGTSSFLAQDSAVYTTATANETTFALPSNYTSDSTVEVYVNGLKLYPAEFTISTANETVTLVTPLEVIGTKVEVIVNTMTTTNLPISDTLSSSSTNDTASGSKVVYDNLATKVDNSRFAVLTGSVANTELSLGGKTVDYPEGFGQNNCVVISAMKHNHTTNVWTNYYSIFDITEQMNDLGLNIQMWANGIKLVTLTNYVKNQTDPNEKWGYDYRVVLMKIS